MSQASPLQSASTPVSHNQIGQRLGRKGQETRERILAAMLRLLADPDGPPVTLAGVAKEAQVRPPNLYLYFPDLGELLLAALARVRDISEAAFLDRLRERWPDGSIQSSCLAFVRAHHEYWMRNARLLHMRNAMADAGDLRVLHYRNDVTTPLIALIAEQMRPSCGTGNVCNQAIATVLLTGLERLATVLTNPQFLLVSGQDEQSRADHTDRLIAAEAEVIALVVGHRRGLTGD